MCDTVFVDVPSDGFDGLTFAGLAEWLAVFVPQDFTIDRVALSFYAALFTHIESDGVGSANGSGVEVDVVRDEKISDSDGRHACFRVEFGGAVIRFPPGIFELLRHAFVFSATDGSEIFARCCAGGMFVQENRDFEFITYPFCQFFGELDEFVHSDICDRYKRADVRGSHARVCALVFAHVDEFSGFFDGCEGGVDYRFRFADEGNHGAVGCFSWVHIQELYALDGSYGVGNLANNGHIPAFAKVGYTFDEGSALHRSLNFLREKRLKISIILSGLRTRINLYHLIVR